MSPLGTPPPLVFHEILEIDQASILSITFESEMVAWIIIFYSTFPSVAVIDQLGEIKWLKEI